MNPPLHSKWPVHINNAWRKNACLSLSLSRQGESHSSDLLHFLGNFRVVDLSTFDQPAIRFRRADDARKVFEMDKKYVTLKTLPRM